MRLRFCLLVVPFFAACKEPGYKTPPPEIAEAQGAKATLPGVPSFEITGDVKRLRVKGAKAAGTQVEVKGYITWVYDCVAEIRKQGESDEVVKQRIAEQPQLCKKAHFYLGDKPTTDPDQSLWILDVAQPLREDQIKHGTLTPEQIAEHNAKIVPHKKGDQVVIKGLFEKKPSNMFGRVIYQSMTNLTTPAPEPETET